MIPFNEYLARIRACESARIWVGNKTAEQAWLECGRSDWMISLLWRLSPNDRRLRFAAADFAERAWPHIDNAATDAYAAATAADRAAQADILRKYFPANEIARMVRAAIKEASK